VAATVLVQVPDPDDVLATYGAGALVRLERADASDFAGAVEIAALAVASGVLQFSYFDAAGSASKWYRTRYSTASPAIPDDYSAYGPGFQASSGPSYASLSQFLLTFQQVITDERRLQRIQQALEDSAAEINTTLGYDFFQHPASGVDDFVFDSHGGSLLLIPPGMVMVGDVALSFNEGISYTTLASDEWMLEPVLPAPGQPQFFLRLLKGNRFPGGHFGFNQFRLGSGALAGHTGVKLIDSVLGWPAVPADAIEANLARARQLTAADPGAAGIEPEALLEPPLGANRLPDPMWRLFRNYEFSRVTGVMGF
jgi:hypothetical protein